VTGHFGSCDVDTEQFAHRVIDWYREVQGGVV